MGVGDIRKMETRWTVKLQKLYRLWKVIIFTWESSSIIFEDEDISKLWKKYPQIAFSPKLTFMISLLSKIEDQEDSLKVSKNITIAIGQLTCDIRFIFRFNPEVSLPVVTPID